MTSEKKSFTEVRAKDRNLPEIGVGILGYGFMGKVHSTGYMKVPSQTSWAPAIPKLVAICGRNEEKVKKVALRYGYQGYYTDWKDLVKNERIQIFDNCGPDNVHSEPIIAAAKEGKHIICEKPLAMTLSDAKKMVEIVEDTRVKNMCSFNYRFIPAVKLAYYLIKKGAVGKIYSFRGHYLQEVGRNPNESLENVWYATGSRSGVMLGIGCHIIDMARFLLGDIKSVMGVSRTFNQLRPNFKGEKEKVIADEENSSIFEFENGTIGTITSSGISSGRKNYLNWEINGSKGSMIFNLEDLNHLQVYLENSSMEQVKGFSNISVTESCHPYFDMAWAPGHNIGWESTHFYQIFHLIDSIINNKPIGPEGATFEDGYKVQCVMNAIKESSKIGKIVKLD